jgi:hypothetical protein
MLNARFAFINFIFFFILNNKENRHNLVAKGGTFIEYCYITLNRMQTQKINWTDCKVSHLRAVPKHKKDESISPPPLIPGGEI